MIVNYERRILSKSFKTLKYLNDDIGFDLFENEDILYEAFMVLKYLKRGRMLKEEMELDLFEKECYEMDDIGFDLRKIKLVLLLKGIIF